MSGTSNESDPPAANSQIVTPLYCWPNRGLRQLVDRRWTVSTALLVLLLCSIVIPLVITAGYSISAYTTYNALRTHAESGVQHLLGIKTIFTGTNVYATLLDTNKLKLSEEEFAAAHADFTQTQSLIDHTALIHTVTQYLPQYRSQVTTARAASQIGIDIAEIGSQLAAAMLVLAPRLRSPLVSETQMPLVTSNDLALVRATIDIVEPYLEDIQTQMRFVSLDALPLNAHQREQLSSWLPLLPQLDAALVAARDLGSAADWLLGVDQPRTFLVQTMDRAELRATGGFTGQYGELQISGGRVAPFSLHDISFVEYSENSPTWGHLAPPAYRSWWPFANWGLRDSNLSADFPTSARIAIEQYKLEVRRDVDGVILLTPLLAEHLLQITGPISVPQYHETITAQNLEERLHYYQLDNTGIRKEEIVEHVEDPAQARKLFTSALLHALMEHIRHATPNELLSIARQVLQDLQTKDLQIYMTNPVIEDFLMEHGLAAQMDTSAKHDGFSVVQVNASASKASQYVQTILHDNVSLDQSGGATHTMQLRLVYNQLGPVYGLDTYRDYLRVYVPSSAKFLFGNGFDTGVPLCGGPFVACAPNGIYPHDELVCPTGGYDAGAAAPMLNDPYLGAWHPLDKIGPPTNFDSDELGRAMFGGFVVVPKNCTMTVTLSWYVPSTGYGPYSLLVQRQAGTFPELDLTVLPTPDDCSLLATSGLHFSGILTQDTSFSLAYLHPSQTSSRDCYPQSKV